MLIKRVLLIVTLILFSSVSTVNFFAQETPQDTKKGISYTHEQEYLFDVFKNRRSVRKFKSTPVPKEHITKILDIARSAPTAGNQQPWKFLIIQDRTKLDELKNACITSSLEVFKKSGNPTEDQIKQRKVQVTEYFENCLFAPVYIVVLVDKHSKYPGYNRHDGPLAAGYLMIAARALGYGTVFFTDSIPDAATKKVFNIPDRFERICIMPVGVPEQWPEPPKKKALEEFVVFEKFVLGVNYTLPVVRKAIKLDPKILETYVGKYELNPDFIITITRENGQLHAQATGQPTFEIFPEAENKFFLKVTDAQITFIKDEKRKVTKLILHQNGRDMTAKKTE